MGSTGLDSFISPPDEWDGFQLFTPSIQGLEAQERSVCDMENEVLLYGWTALNTAGTHTPTGNCPLLDSTLLPVLVPEWGQGTSGCTDPDPAVPLSKAICFQSHHAPLRVQSASAS